MSDRGPVGPLGAGRPMRFSHPLALLLLALGACGVSLRAPEAPGGTVQSPEGRAISLADLWADHPLVVVFYRGWW